MFPDPPEDNNKTVFCQTCGVWQHPRDSCARDPSHETAPLPVMMLRRHGPSSSEVFSRTSYESKRKHRIAQLNLTSHSGGTNSVFGNTKTIYYLTHEHPPAEVIKKWIAVNRDVLADRELTTESITRALSNKAFKNAWSKLQCEMDFDVLNKSDHSRRGGNYYEERICPFCNDTIKSLPGHLPCSAQSED